MIAYRSVSIDRAAEIRPRSLIGIIGDDKRFDTRFDGETRVPRLSPKRDLLIIERERVRLGLGVTAISHRKW